MGRYIFSLKQFGVIHMVIFFRHCEREFTIVICVPGLRYINCCPSMCGCQPSCTIWWLWGLWWLRRPQWRHWQQLCRVWWLRRTQRPRQLWWSWSTWWHWKLLWLIVENCSELDVWMWWMTKPQARWPLNNTFLFLIKWFQQILMFCCMNYMCGWQGLWVMVVTVLIWFLTHWSWGKMAFILNPAVFKYIWFYQNHSILYISFT